MQTLYGGSLMRMVTRIFPVAALALGLGAAQISAQQPGNNTFQWYVGGQGGVMNFETPLEGHITKPVGGVHLLVVAKRTGLLVSMSRPSARTSWAPTTWRCSIVLAMSAAATILESPGTQCASTPPP